MRDFNGIKILSRGMAALVALAATAMAANAHTISIGYENAGPGSVNIWAGTYSVGHAALANEGSLNLVGVNGNTFASTTIAFNLLAGVGVGLKPSGLVDGVTNFYAPNISDPNAALVGSEAGFNASCPACGPVDRWQGVLFSGLTAGDYQFTWIPAASPTAQWDILNNNFNGIFTLSGSVVNPNPVPLPAALPLFAAGLAIAGVAGRRKKRAKTSA